MVLKIYLDPSPEYTKELLAMISTEVAAKLQEVLDEIKKEGEEVKTKIDELKGQIGSGMSDAEVLAALDNIKSAVDGIYTPDPVPAPEPTPEPTP